MNKNVSSSNKSKYSLTNTSNSYTSITAIIFTKIKSLTITIFPCYLTHSHAHQITQWPLRRWKLFDTSQYSFPSTQTFKPSTWKKIAFSNFPKRSFQPKNGFLSQKKYFLNLNIVVNCGQLLSAIEYMWNRFIFLENQWKEKENTSF